MADYAPPPGPPPPKVPEGWKAVWNPQYSEWFFVNIYTKQSQWEKPTEPVYLSGETPPPGAPPGYAGSPSAGAMTSHPTGMSEKSGFSSNNPYANVNEDEKLARKLQEEEEARAGRQSGDVVGQANNYYHQPEQAGGYGQQSSAPYAQGGQSSYQETGPQQDRAGKAKGLIGKLLGKATGGSSSSSSHGYPQQHQGYPQQGYGQPQGYGGAPGGYYGGGYQQRPMGMPMGGMGGGIMGGGRRPGGGMGAGGAMALGAGGGLLGGALLASSMGDGGDGGNTYNNYGDDGGDYGGDYGGDGGDMGGGDFGGGGD